MNRVANGVAVLIATDRALRLLGLEVGDDVGRVLGGLAGGRDVALGALALAAGSASFALAWAASRL